MPENPEKPVDARYYLAVERTFLAWIRSAIAFLAFGIAIEKFDFFLKFALKTQELPSLPPIEKYPLLHYLGKLLIGIGILSLIFGKINFYKTLKKVETGAYRTSFWLYFLYFIILLILSLGLFLYFLFG